ncbi:MAG TPA: hypothetical protein VMT89_00570 [Candidatus Acidoferrales bacterium]|nr:hypothetical protein [Candidatus Acidoferrales bacterium]
METRTWLKRTAAVAGTIILMGVLAGCGINVSVTTTPSTPGIGQQVDMKIKLTNPSQCPAGNVEALAIPFVTLPLLPNDNGLYQTLNDLIGAACSGQPLEGPGGIICHIVDGGLVCEGSGDMAPDSSGSTSFTLGRSGITCQRTGSGFKCPLPTGPPAGADASGADTLLCMNGGDEAFCEIGTLGGGQMAMTDLIFNVPPPPGAYFDLAFAGAAQLGVCKSGTNQGNPCSGDGDCGGVTGSCGDGICVDDMTQQPVAKGCSSGGMDCSAGTSCVVCVGSGDSLPIGIGCDSVVVQGAPAPTMSRWGLVAVAMVLLAIGALGIRMKSNRSRV